VSAASADDVWVIGYNWVGGGPDVALHWDGAAWGRLDPPLGSHHQLGDIVARDGDALAVGCDYPDDFTCLPLTAVWDGSEWTVSREPSAACCAVDAVAGDDVWAVGGAGDRRTVGAVASHYDGQTWTRAELPVAPTRLTLSDVTMLAPDDAWAVGSRASRKHGVVMLAMHWNGAEWSVVRDRAVRVRGHELVAVDGSGPNDVWALRSSSGRSTGLVHYNGHRWRAVDLTDAPANLDLNGIAVSSPDAAWVVGAAETSTRIALGSWDGESWKF
jgi:hypothetical protein